ncbi:MAG: septum formation protein Maf [Clostridia bacterium]|nr:septum formation protein Maf [Clostridia bacterium]
MNHTPFTHPTLILASGSPRRHELLTVAGISHIVRVPQADESLPPRIDPRRAVAILSMRKATAALAAAPETDALVLAADTVVAVDGEILGKPHSAEEAQQMLCRLSGRSHTVCTGITIANRTKSVTAVEEAAVHMRPILPEEIDAYIATGDPMDKAGAYGIQGKAGLFVTGIVGDYFTIVGLPVCRVGNILRKHFGFTLI